jgi:hypothetical protein
MDRQDDNSDDKAATSAASPATGTTGILPVDGSWLRRFLSHDSGPFAQFVKYGAIGVASTLVQMLVFYCLASTICRCLGPEDWAVKWFGLPAVEISRFVRGLRFAIDTVKSYGLFQEVLETMVGCTVSTHCGPDTLGVLFLRKCPHP